MTATIKAGPAMFRVLESWGAEHIYGIPGAPFYSALAALRDGQGGLRFIQVRHEETAAMAASASAKLGGKIGVCFGCAGPGVTHLLNGLYDAKMDRAPVLAFIGQLASTAMNGDTFQEMNAAGLFADVSVCSRTAMTPESLPRVVDEAVRQAYAHKGVATVILPADFEVADIPDCDASTAGSRRASLPPPDDKDLEAAVRLMEKAERPVLFAGRGAAGAGGELLALSEHYSMPVVLSALAKGIIPDAAENLMGTAGRLSTKPANEALAAADLVVVIGSDFPLAKDFFPQGARGVQVDIDPLKLGRRHRIDAAVLGDAGESMRRLIAMGKKKELSPFLRACRVNRQNWLRWLRGFAGSTGVPLRPEPVFREINRIAEDDAIFVTDVGNTTTLAVRLLEMNGKGQRFTTSGWFGTMGYGVPGGIAAKLSHPGRQVFTLSGDGAFSMVMQDIITQVKYKLPIINVVFSNNILGYIRARKEDAGRPDDDVALGGADFAKAAEAMGARGFSVTEAWQLPGVFDRARRSDRPVVIDVNTADERPFPAHAMVLDPEAHGVQEIKAFKKRYQVRGMPLLRELL